jgi:DMSO/TMAO reductase YedYZ molybdopterin-dependent catalytic subunit
MSHARLDLKEPWAAPTNRELPRRAQSLEITPAGAHFVRCHFAAPPPPDRLQLGGALAAPARFSPSALQARADRSLAVTIECAGNGRAQLTPLPRGEPWRDGAVSTAVWTGVRLVDVLEEAGLRDDVVEILFAGADGFQRSLPIDVALDPAVLIATEMNGEPIPPIHGAPARLVVPGWYGMASVKWLRAIVALTRPFRGAYQSADYRYDDGPVTTMRPRALIVEPSGPVSRGRVTAWGWAWSATEIDSVSVSLDSGRWRPAPLVGGPGPHAWVRWQAELDLTPGRHSLRARARDRAGNLQPETPYWNRLGYGNNGTGMVVIAAL